MTWLLDLDFVRTFGDLDTMLWAFTTSFQSFGLFITRGSLAPALLRIVTVTTGDSDIFLDFPPPPISAGILRRSLTDLLFVKLVKSAPGFVPVAIEDGWDFVWRFFM